MTQFRRNEQLHAGSLVNAHLAMENPANHWCFPRVSYEQIWWFSRHLLVRISTGVSLRGEGQITDFGGLEVRIPQLFVCSLTHLWWHIMVMTCYDPRSIAMFFLAVIQMVIKMTTNNPHQPLLLTVQQHHPSQLGWQSWTESLTSQNYVQLKNNSQQPCSPTNSLNSRYMLNQASPPSHPARASYCPRTFARRRLTTDYDPATATVFFWAAIAPLYSCSITTHRHSEFIKCGDVPCCRRQCISSKTMVELLEFRFADSSFAQ